MVAPSIAAGLRPVVIDHHCRWRLSGDV